MQQEVLWHDTMLDAVGSAVTAAGGKLRVAKKLWPALDDGSALARMRACLNPDHAQKFDLEEVVMIGTLAAEVGDFSIINYQARVWHCEVAALTPSESKKRAKKARRLALLDQLRQLEGDE